MGLGFAEIPWGRRSARVAVTVREPEPCTDAFEPQGSNAHALNE